MTTLESELDNLCRWIEKQWPGTKTECQPFGADGMDYVICVTPSTALNQGPRNIEEAIIRETYLKRKRIRRKLKSNIGVFCVSPKSL